MISNSFKLNQCDWFNLYLTSQSRFCKMTMDPVMIKNISFISCVVGGLFMLIGQALTISIIWSFGIWSAIVNLLYIGFVVWCVKSESIEDYKNILIILHAYCMSGSTFTTSLGIDAGNFGYMSMVGGILSIIGLVFLGFILFSDADIVLPVKEPVDKSPFTRFRSKDMPKASNDTILTNTTDATEVNPKNRQSVMLSDGGNRYSEYSEAEYSEADLVDEKEAKAKYHYDGNPEDPSELKFKKGDILYVVPTNKNWWEATDSQGNRGIVPANYLKL